MSIYKKLLKVQSEVGTVSKDSKNPFFKSKYFDINKLIEVVNPVLSNNGLVLLQPIRDGYVYSEIIDSESGESVSSCLQLPNITKPQEIGSAISYYRRYTLSSLLGLQADDDDANLSNASVTKNKPKPKANKQNIEALKKSMNKENYSIQFSKASKHYDLTQDQINELEMYKDLISE